MKRSVWLSIILIMAAMGVLKAWNREHPNASSYGTEQIDGLLRDGTYHNKYFGMTVKVPDGWNPLDDETRKQAMKMGGKFIAGDDKTLNAAIDASELRSASLLAFTKFPMGAPVPFNPSLVCGVEKVSDFAGIKAGKDYLYHMKKLCEMSKTPIVFDPAISSENIGGIPFDVEDAKVTVESMTVRQKYYVAIIKGYALLFVASANSVEEEQEVVNLLKNVHFDKP